MGYKQLSPVDVDEGGAGRTSATAYAVICGGTTATGAHQSIASVGTSGQVLTSNGAGALPTFQDASGGVTGPGSSTDNAIARWDGTGGTAIQNSTATISDNGEMVNTSQPAFCAFNSTNANNVTGDGSSFLLGDTDVASALTERFDQGSDFTTGSSSGADFTAPVTGKYHLDYCCLFQTVNGLSCDISILTSNETYTYGNETANSSNWAQFLAVLADMDSADTCTWRAVASGGGATADIFGDASTARTYVSGFLAC